MRINATLDSMNTEKNKTVTNWITTTFDCGICNGIYAETYYKNFDVFIDLLINSWGNAASGRTHSGRWQPNESEIYIRSSGILKEK